MHTIHSGGWINFQYTRKYSHTNIFGTRLANTSSSVSGLNPISNTTWLVMGIYQKNSLSDGKWINGPLDITHYATTKVRGNNINDVVVVGAFGEFLHWNGVRWKSYIDQTGLSNGSYTSVAVSGNLVVAVGGNNAQAVITMGTRQ